MAYMLIYHGHSWKDSNPLKSNQFSATVKLFSAHQSNTTSSGLLTLHGRDVQKESKVVLNLFQCDARGSTRIHIGSLHSGQHSRNDDRRCDTRLRNIKFGDLSPVKQEGIEYLLTFDSCRLHLTTHMFLKSYR